MRVTSEMVVNQSVQRLSNRISEYEQVQSRLATGKDVQKPSDDPARANRGLSLRASEKSRVQEARNAEDAMSWLNVTDSQLQNTMDKVQRARELTVQGANQSGQQSRDAIAAEIESLRDELVEIGNEKLRGKHLFGGYTEGPAVERADAEDEDYAFRGNDDDGNPHEITRRVGEGERVRINVTAQEAFGNEDDNLFADLDRLVERLRGDGDVGASLSDLDRAQERISSALASTGARTNRVESALDRSDDMLFHIRDELSQVEDTDYAEAVMELQLQDMGLQSTLQALGRALPPSLAGFLR
ncbi:flagellar hook-associated protein 3 [Egibacter rhizosphaerae]|uniref:Flagellar hook-associated protein 3 n=1 Tax=Egibacter rhizosphaerae TaxID=1670831 RepID=A0A411YCP2_9ACTN|nr:flagellar hook-associated protein FlgL [Egibacter rhizosphaerae]QBI18932.1 flagellar hook-associated protein 3 [Egibacter rhizosphaerae]